MNDFTNQSENAPVDIILTWVDPTDLNWQNDFNIHNPKKNSDANSAARFRDLGTLKYVFRSIENFCPWINRIHFVTSGHLPSWLDVNNKKLNVLKHSDIFLNKSDLPVFNSSAIELNFLGIENLADQFILFNDDMLLFKAAEREVFFRNGLPCDFLIQNPVKASLVSLLYPSSTWVKNIKKVVSLISSKISKWDSIRNHFDKYFNRVYGIKGNLQNVFSLFEKDFRFFEHYHHPQPYLKRTWEAVSLVYGQEIKKTSSSKFRKAEDISHYIFRYWHLTNGEFKPRFAGDFEAFNLSSIKQVGKCIKSMRKKRFVCINDVPELDEKRFAIAKEMIISALESIFPNKSSFEV